MTQPTLPPTPTSILSFGSSDPSGATGIQGDILTAAYLQCHCASVITSYTIQNSQYWAESHSIADKHILNQADHILSDMPVKTIKISALYNVNTIKTLAQLVSNHSHIPVILHLGSSLLFTSGNSKQTLDKINTLFDILTPQAHIIVADQYVLCALLKLYTKTEITTSQAAQLLLEQGTNWVLLTNVHHDSPPVNHLLYQYNAPVRNYPWAPLPFEYKGVNSNIAMAVACFNAAKLDVPNTCDQALELIWQSLAMGLRPGLGQVFPNRLYWKPLLQR